MKKECFTCNNKITTELTKEEREKIKQQNIAENNRFKSVPELIFHCKLTGKQISQIDPACDDYEGNNFMEDIRMDIAKTARKLRNEL